MKLADRIAAAVGDLPALPEVATRVLQEVQNSKATARTLEEVILRDQALSAKVLRVANSAYFGARGQISSLSRAIVVMGFNTLRSVVVSGASEALHRSKSSCFKDRILWQHSVAVGVAARAISERCRYGARDEAYLGGLLHDVGKTVLDQNTPEQYHLVIEQVYNEDRTFVEAEKEIFGFDHTDVGALVAERWGLAPGLQEAVHLHHRPAEAGEDPQLVGIVSLANSICVKLCIGPERDAEMNLAELESAGILNLDESALSQIEATVQDRLREEQGELLMV